MAGWLDGIPERVLSPRSLLIRHSTPRREYIPSPLFSPISFPRLTHLVFHLLLLLSSSPPLLSSPLCCDPSLHIPFLVLNYRFTLSAGIRYLVVRPIDSLPPPSI
jgi:hypothetical protein